MYGEDCYYRPIGELIESTWMYNNKLRSEVKEKGTYVDRSV